MGNRPFATIGAIVFGIVAIVHLLRLVRHFHLIIGTHLIPLWVSWPGVIVPGVLAIGLWRESRR